MVQKAADSHLEGYRELGTRAAEAEIERDNLAQHLSTVNDELEKYVVENAELRKQLDDYQKHYVTRTSLIACECLRDEYAAQVADLESRMKPIREVWRVIEANKDRLSEDSIFSMSYDAFMAANGGSDA
ncbi:MAG: hypothetical protein WC373_11850 [Smithella sp.]|jgi:chromosome condensin MukBEF ATPase and DNA-binding subunit MukB